MARAVVYFLFLLLSNSCTEGADAQARTVKTSSDDLTELQILSRAVQGLHTKMEGQTALLNSLGAKEETQARLLAKLEENLNTLAYLLNIVVMEGQKQATALDKVDAKVDAQAALLNSLNQNVEIQATSLRHLEAESKLHRSLLNNLDGSAVTEANLLNNLATKVDGQTIVLTKLQAQSNVQATALLKLENNTEIQTTSLEYVVAEVEWHEPIALYKTDRTIVALEGEDVEIWCVVSGRPLPEIEWTLENDAPISDRVMLENNGKVLKIKNVRSSDEATYTCVAANGIGNPVSQTVSLKVYGKAQECHRLIESDTGSLEIEPSSAGCLWVIKLQNMTGIRLELDPNMTEPMLFIPEQNTSNSNVSFVRTINTAQVLHKFEGKTLAIVAPPRRVRTTLTWTGLSVDDSEVASSTKFVKDFYRTLEWQPISTGTNEVFWVFQHETTVYFKWTLNSVDQARHEENACDLTALSVLEIKADGNITEIQKTCNGSSKGSFKLESTSQVLVLLQMKSAEAATSKLQVTWTKLDEALKKNAEGIFAGTDNGWVSVIPWNSTVPKATSLNRVRGLTFDWNSRKVYWLEHNVGIKRANCDGTDSKLLLSDTSSELRGMAMEPISGNLYYGNLSSEAIRVCNINATRCSTLQVANSGNLSSIVDMAVHRSKGFLFWSIWHQKVIRANLDGSNATTILEGKVTRIDVDEHKDRLYYGLYNYGIGSCDLNGQDIQMQPDVSGGVQDIAIDGEEVYYATWDTQSIYVVSKLGENCRLIARLGSKIYHLALFGAQVHNLQPNQCGSSQCAHLCSLITPNSYRCLCPDNQELNPDGKTCKH